MTGIHLTLLYPIDGDHLRPSPSNNIEAKTVIHLQSADANDIEDLPSSSTLYTTRRGRKRENRKKRKIHIIVQRPLPSNASNEMVQIIAMTLAEHVQILQVWRG